MSPWVEIINTDNSPIGIENFYLTDDPDDLTKWRIPRKTVAGNGRSLVYLSGKGGMTLLGNEVHSDFKFTGQDDYLALVRPDGVEVVNELRDIPKQRAGVSYGLREDTLQPAYFRVPTPALPNRSPVSGLVADTQFTINRGFFDEPFKVEISTETPEATILYTTDGTPPSKGNVFTGPIGEKYVGPITIETTTVLRAFAYKSGLGSSNVETQTYLFIDDVIEQKTMRRSITDSVEYGPQMRKALTDLPSISLSRLRIPSSSVVVLRTRMTLNLQPQLNGLTLTEAKDSKSMAAFHDSVVTSPTLQKIFPSLLSQTLWRFKA